MTGPEPYVAMDQSSSSSLMAMATISAQLEFLADEQASNQAALLTAIASVVTAVEALAPL